MNDRFINSLSYNTRYINDLCIFNHKHILIHYFHKFILLTWSPKETAVTIKMFYI